MINFIANKKQDEILHALYSAVVTINKYKNDDELKRDINMKFRDYAKELDLLEVPFSIQNRVASAGENKNNWDRYNKTVLNEIYTLA